MTDQETTRTLEAVFGGKFAVEIERMIENGVEELRKAGSQDPAEGTAGSTAAPERSGS